jgi:hypothetical protein
VAYPPSPEVSVGSLGIPAYVFKAKSGVFETIPLIRTNTLNLGDFIFTLDVTVNGDFWQVLQKFHEVDEDQEIPVPRKTLSLAPLRETPIPQKGIGACQVGA